MQEIRVISCENKFTVKNKPYKALEVEANGETRKVSMWSFFPNFANIKEGSVFLGNMVKEGNYWNLSFEGQEKRTTGLKTSNSPILESQLKVQDRISKDVEKAQNNTETSVKLSSSMNKAIDLAIAEFKDKTVLDNLDAAVLKWRKFIWKHWNEPIDDPIYPD